MWGTTLVNGRRGPKPARLTGEGPKMAEKVAEKKKPAGRGRRNPAGNLVATYGAPFGVGFIEAAIAAKVGFYEKLAPEAKALFLGALGVAAMRKGKQALGGALLGLAGQYAGRRVMGGGSMQGLADASDAEMDEVADRYSLGDVDDDVDLDVGALPGDEALGALPGDESLEGLEDYDYDYQAA